MLRLIGRIALWALLALLGLALLLGLSIPADALIGGGRVAALTNTEIAGPAGPIRAFVARPTTPGPHPAVIMIHEWWGLRPDVVEKAQALAAQGYVVIAPDTFRGASTAWIPRAIYQVSTTPPAQAIADLDAVYAWAAAQPDVRPDAIAVMGFCYGGRTALLYTTHNPAVAATAIFYGMADVTPAQLAGIRGPVLGVFGGADSSIPLAEVERLEASLVAAGVPTRFAVYADQPHAFVGGIDDINAGGADREAWDLLIEFLAAELQGQAAGAGARGPGLARPAPAGAGATLLGALHHRFVCGW